MGFKTANIKSLNFSSMCMKIHKSISRKDLGHLVKAMYRNLGLLYLYFILCSFASFEQLYNGFPWTNFHDLKASCTKLNVLVYLRKDLKGSGAVIHPKISPNFGLKEHYDRKGDGDFYFYGIILI